jgi:fibronectin-binding autotransporter adhesin
MKPKSTLLHFLALVGSSLIAMSSASAQTTYTWTQTATGDQSWTTAGNWDVNGVFVSDASNELRFFAGTTAPDNHLGAGAAGASQVVIDVPISLSLNTLTLNGRGPNSDAGSFITIGTSASTWTLGDGTTSTVSLNSALGGGGANRDLRYTIGANLTLVGDASGITTFTGNSPSGYGAIFSGNIGESVAGKGITKSDTSLLIFSGNNSYTGTTSVTGGVLRLSSANALSGGIGTTGGTSALTINGGVVELEAGDFSRGLGTGSSQFQITGGTSGFSAYGGPRVVTVGGDASLELQWGSTHFQPGTLVLNQAYGFNTNVAPYPNGSIELTNGIDLNGATRTVQVGANYALISGDIRTTSGTAGLTKTGSGTLVLTGNNSYNGNTTNSGGTLSVGAASNFGSGSSGLIMNGGTLQITGTALTSISGLGHAVTFNNNAKGFDIHNAANTFTVDQVLSGTTLLKSGIGTLVLNQNNTFTGATTATGGGTLVLDYATNNGSKLSDTAALTLNGSALVLRGGSHNEVVGSTSLASYTSNSISRDGGSSTISLGAISTANFFNSNRTLAISEANLATTTSDNVNGILYRGYVTVGSHFGSNDGSNNIVEYSGYTAATTAGGGNANVVHQLTGGGTMAGNLASYSLRIVNDDDSNVLDLGSNRINLTNNTTLLYAGGFDNQYTINGTGFITSASGNQFFAINTSAGTTLTVNARTSQNGAAVSKAGEGTLVIGADNGSGVSMSTVHVQQGVLRVINSNGLGTTAAGTIVQGGAALELANNISIGAEALSLNGAGISQGGALRNQSGNNSWGGLITTGTSGARINADASTSLTLTGGIATTLTQDVTFGGVGNTTVSTTAISGSGSLIKDGAGTLTLAAANTYTGETMVSSGTLYVTGALSNSAVSVKANGAIGSNGIAGNLGNGLTLEAGGNLDLTGATLGLNSTGILNLTGGSLTLGNLTFQDLVGWDWTNAAAGTYQLMDGTFDIAWGSTAYLTEGTAYDFGNGKKGYFTEGSLNVVIIPEPRAAFLGGLGLLALLRRRRN